MPTPDRRHRNFQQLGQHGRCIQPPNRLFWFNQAQALPELRLGDDLQTPLPGSPLHIGVEKRFVFAERQLVGTDHNQID